MVETVSKKEMVLTILKARYNNPKNPESHGDFRSLMNKKREDLEQQYEPALSVIARETPRWDREAFLGHKDFEIILCQCGNRLTQEELFKDFPSYRTEAVRCPKCHMNNTLRYQRKSERRTELFIERLNRDIETGSKEEKDWAERFLQDPTGRLEWAMSIFENTARKREAQLILHCMSEIAEHKYTLSDLIKNVQGDALRHAKYPSHSKSVTSNLMYQFMGAAAAYYLEQLEGLQDTVTDLDREEKAQ